ncbi:hypothetical protein BLGI_3903 [Brevibacillus laterosporus GI-9]|nr:hypothetical protein BLGI_3903 [Brevibacillus laterosporus GI-9]
MLKKLRWINYEMIKAQSTGDQKEEKQQRTRYATCHQEKKSALS